MRKCNLCRKQLPLTDFCKCTRCKDGINYSCKKCIKKYHASIKDKLQAYQKEYQKVYQKEHAAELNEYQKEYQYRKYHNDPAWRENYLVKQRARHARIRQLKKQNDK